MKRYYLLRSGILYNHTGIEKKKDVVKIAKAMEKQRTSKKVSLSEYQVVEQTISYKHVGTVKVTPSSAELVPVNGVERPTMADTVHLMIPTSLDSEAVCLEVKEALERILQATYQAMLKSTRGRAKAGDLF